MVVCFVVLFGCCLEMSVKSVECVVIFDCVGLTVSCCMFVVL